MARSKRQDYIYICGPWNNSMFAFFEEQNALWLADQVMRHAFAAMPTAALAWWLTALAAKEE